MKENSYGVSKVFLKINQILWKFSPFQKIRNLFYFIDSVLLIGTKASRTFEKIEKEKKKVLIVYNMALGDGVMFLGIAQHYRNLYPREQYELSIACQSAFQSLYEKTEIFDKILGFDFASAIVNLKNRRELFKKLRIKQYDIVIDPVGCDNCTTNIFVTRAVLGKEKIGVLDTTLPDIQCPNWMRNRIYTSVVKLQIPKMHLIEFYAEFVQALGDETCTPHPAHFDSIDFRMDLPKEFFIVFPTASMDVKRWPLDRYAFITKKIQEKTGMPLVVCGTNHDRPVVEKFLNLIPDVKTYDLIGKTSIREFIELIGNASLVVTNDTSAYHIAVAKQCNVAMICGGYTFTRYANYHYQEKGYKDPILVYKNMECFDCNNYCKYNNRDIFPCIDAISKEYAWEKVEQMLN